MGVSVFSQSRIYLVLSCFILLSSCVTATRTAAKDTEMSLIRTYLQLKNEYETKLSQYPTSDFHSEHSLGETKINHSTMYVNSTVEDSSSGNSTLTDSASGNSTSTDGSSYQGADVKAILEGFGYSFTFIFMSEIGDKTFIFVMLYASKMNGFSLTFVASFVLWAMHVLGVYLGNIFMMVLGEYWLKIISIVAFLIFGIMMIKEAITEEDEDADTKIKEVEDEMLHKDSVDKNDKESGFFRRLVNWIFYNNAVNVGVIILWAEMGDRSQISAVALSAFYEFWVVAVAGSVGHILAVVIAVLFGVIVARFVTEKCTNYIGGILFLIFSAYSLFNLYQLENGAVSV